MPADAVLPQAAGECIGVLMLDTRFPRVPGDVGHPATFGGRARYKVVPGAFPREIVTSAAALRASPLSGLFVNALRELQDEGAARITTSCGFLVLLQRELQSAARVPVTSSSLLMLPALLGKHDRVGVLTISEENLTPEFFTAAGVPISRRGDVIVQGVDPNGEFASAILGNRTEMDLVRAEADVVEAAIELKSRVPDIKVIVLECTNMPPYADAIREATKCKVVSLLDALKSLP